MTTFSGVIQNFDHFEKLYTKNMSLGFIYDFACPLGQPCLNTWIKITVPMN